MDENEDLTDYRVHMYKIVIPIFLVVSGFAVIANALVILALRMTKVRNATVTLILSLTVADMWTSSIVAISLLYNSYLPMVKGTYPNPCFSLALEMLRTGGLITSTLHLLLISIHHYIGIVRPYTDKRKMRNVATALCITVWLAPLIVLFGLASSISGQGFHNCMDVRFYHSRLFRVAVSSLLIAIFVFIIFCYTKLLLLLRAQANHWKASRSAQKRVSRENRTLWTTILICSSVFIGWAPATIHFTITCDTCDLLKEQQFRVLFLFSCVQLSFILGKSLMNPLIYSLRIPEVDMQLKSLMHKYVRPIWKLCGCNPRKDLDPKAAPSRSRIVAEGVLERPSSSDDQFRHMATAAHLSPVRVSMMGTVGAGVTEAGVTTIQTVTVHHDTPLQESEKLLDVDFSSNTQYV
uniref:G_PROTEIN_RECEP_F1_2 domain-containing protein n=1 Tax=Panagrellus redivivus TaxID=6233 RepID=A0A7E4V9Y3_PANRE